MKFFLVIINLALIMGGTWGGLVLVDSEPIYWLLELPLALLFCLTLQRTTTSTSPTTIASWLAIRTYLLLVLCVLGAITLLSQLENWRHLIGFMCGCFCGLWLDWLQKFRRDRVVISWQGRVIIALKFISIFTLDISLMVSGQVESNMMLFISVLVFSQFFGATLTELITVNIRGAIGQQIPLPRRLFKPYAFMDCLVSAVFFTSALLIDKSLLGFTICAFAHLMVTAFGLIQVASLKEKPVMMEMVQLEKIVLIVNPTPKGEVNFCVGKPLST